MMKKFDHCPVTLTCTASVVFQDDVTKKVFNFRTDLEDFVPHTCSTKSASKHKFAYTAVWVNTRTGGVRNTGLQTMERGALRPPNGGKHDVKRTREGKPSEWELVRLYRSPLAWEEIDIPEHFKEEFLETYKVFTGEEIKDEAKAS